MTLAWYERVPKKDREKQLANMNEGQFLKVLRRASAGHVADKGEVSQAAIAKGLGVKPGFLREVEAGSRPVSYQIAKAYCDAMGLDVTILKKVGRQKLKWPDEGGPPRADPPPGLTDPPKRPRVQRSQEDRDRQQRARAETRALEGADEAVDLDEIKSITVRNQLEESIVLTFKVTPKGNLFVDVHQDCVAAGPVEILKEGFTGVRVSCPPVLEWDVGAKQRKVFEVSVATKREDSD